MLRVLNAVYGIQSMSLCDEEPHRLADWPVHIITGRIKGRCRFRLYEPSALCNFRYDSAPLETLATEIRKLVYTPYVLDSERRLIVEVGMPRVPPEAPRPFFYLDQYENAETLRLVPVDAYAAGRPPAETEPRLIFVFSIGRAGSTLAAQILETAGIASLSEPDVLLGLGQPAQLAALDPPLADWEALYRSCLGALVIALGMPKVLAIKFRAQNSNLFHIRAMLRLYPQAHYVFLFRNVEAWSRSITRTFRLPADNLKWLITENLKAADLVQNSGADVRILEYEDFVHAPERLLEGLVSPEVAVSGKALDEVMQRDSQQGLLDTLNQEGITAGHTEFMAWWQKNRPEAMLQKLGLRL